MPIERNEHKYESQLLILKEELTKIIFYLKRHKYKVRLSSKDMFLIQNTCQSYYFIKVDIETNNRIFMDDKLSKLRNTCTKLYVETVDLHKSILTSHIIKIKDCCNRIINLLE